MAEDSRVPGMGPGQGPTGGRWAGSQVKPPPCVASYTCAAFGPSESTAHLRLHDSVGVQPEQREVGGGTFHIWGTMSTALPPTQARMLGALQFNTHSLVAPFGYQG